MTTKNAEGKAVCILFKCQTWDDDVLIKPELVLDEATGFWVCPKCKASYGKHVQEPFNPFELDSVP